MTTKLFLDLEGTVIDTWDDRNLCNIERVKAFLGDTENGYKNRRDYLECLADDYGVECSDKFGDCCENC